MMKRAFWAGLVASGVAVVVMLVFRLTWRALTVPEVLIDWVTRLLPLNLFTLLVGTIGVWAKRLLVVGLAATLIVIGGGGGVLWRRFQGQYPRLSSEIGGW